MRQPSDMQGSANIETMPPPHLSAYADLCGWRRGSTAHLVAGRELTRPEWEEALPAQPYRAVCRDG
jgi:hypothetical protein